MTSHLPQLCEALKRLGFSSQHEITLYGEVLRLVSDPIATEEDSVFVDAVEKRSGASRRVRIPLTILAVARKNSAPKVKAA